MGGMTAPHSRSPLPHHRLQVFHVARELLICVRDAQISDAKLRDEATRAAKGTCLNIAEGAARVTRADQARAYAIARVEAAEVGAAIEIAVLVGAASAEDEAKIVALASRVVAMLTRLIR
jgi:four helix bundle protein